MTITLQASSLNRVMGCNGSVAMVPGVEQPLDREQTDDQREGDAAHFLAMLCLTDRDIDDPLLMVDRKVTNGVYITPEMAEYVDTFVQDCRADIMEGHEHWVEQAMDFDLSEHTRILCRPDVITWEPISRVLKIRDLKYGFRLVEARDNWTLIAYAMTWIIRTGNVPERIELIIHQPRPHHEDGKRRVCVLTYAELYALYQQMQATIGNLTDELRTGDHCYKCPALVPCRAARNAMLNGIDMSSTVFHDKYATEELGTELLIARRAAKAMDDRIKAMEELMMYRIGDMSEISQDWAIDRDQFGHRKFMPHATSDVIHALTGIDIRKDAMLTPAQAIKKGVPESIIDAFASRPKLPPKLVHKSAAKRAEKLFGKPPA